MIGNTDPVIADGKMMERVGVIRMIGNNNGTRRIGIPDSIRED